MKRTDARRSVWSIGAYATLVAAAVGLFLVIRRYGETLSAPARASLPAEAAGAAFAAPFALVHVLLALAAVVALGRILGRLFAAIRQPPIIGEVIAGILLGPSLLGRLAPGASAYILPPAVAPYLNLVAQLGIVLYMFVV